MTHKNTSKLQADETVVRLIAAQVALIMAVALYMQGLFALIILIVDFALRAFTSQFSPLAAVSTVLTDILRLKPKPIFAAPKKFAAGLGFVLSVAVFILTLFKLFVAADVIGGILILCALLESACNVCLGCYVYTWLVAPVINKKYRPVKNVPNP